MQGPLANLCRAAFDCVGAAVLADTAGNSVFGMKDQQSAVVWFITFWGFDHMHFLVSLLDFRLLTIPAMTVFVWLPLLGVSILLIRLIEPITWAVGKTQWFLKDGKEHPLEAIGMVASVIVFSLAVVWQVFFKSAY